MISYNLTNLLQLHVYHIFFCKIALNIYIFCVFVITLQIHIVKTLTRATTPVARYGSVRFVNGTVRLHILKHISSMTSLSNRTIAEIYINISNNVSFFEYNEAIKYGRV